MRKITVKPEDQLKELKSGVVDIIPESELLEKLKKSYEKDEPLKIKFGADPSRPDIHLGHTVVLQKLRLLQDFGHEIYFLIGDFTAKIGDPTGKSATRPILSDEEVIENAKTYSEQIGKILDMDKTKIVFNNDWIQELTPIDMIKIMAKVTVSSLLERDDFSKRYKAQEVIYMHEFAYPLMQGYDSVAMKSDLELGGTDQTFNLLMGRHLQKSFDQAPQCILTMPILEGTDGVNKMSKSLENYISLEDTPTDMFGKLMSISDELMLRYYELLCRRQASEIEKIITDIKSGAKHPMDAKKELASEIVDYYHKEGSGQEERDTEAHYTQSSRSHVRHRHLPARRHTPRGRKSPSRASYWRPASEASQSHGRARSHLLRVPAARRRHEGAPHRTRRASLTYRTCW